MEIKNEDDQELMFLQTKVYPGLNQGLLQLIEYLVNSDEITIHQERLKKQKIMDKIEQKRVERERLKRELGSDYESSENSLDYEEMGVDREEFERMVNLSKKLANINDDKEDDKNEEIKEVTQNMELDEDEEALEEEKPQVVEQRKNMFSSLSYLSQQLRQIHLDQKAK